MSAIDVLNMPETGKARVGTKTPNEPSSVARRVDTEVVAALLERCKSPENVIDVAKQLRWKGGWREEFELYGEAAKKFPEHKEELLSRQQHMATLGKIRTYSEMERAGIAKIPQREDLLRIDVEA